MREMGRYETVATYFDWDQTHLSEFAEARS